MSMNSLTPSPHPHINVEPLCKLEDFCTLPPEQQSAWLDDLAAQQGWDAYCTTPVCEFFMALLLREHGACLNTFITWCDAFFNQCWAGEGVWASLQWNPWPGDVSRNTAAVKHAMAFANALGVDVLVCPEQTLLGYPLRDMPLRFPNMVAENEAALLELAKASTHTRVMVGVAERRYERNADRNIAWGSTWGKPYYNSAFILGEGGIQGVARKCLLPNYREFEEQRVFEASTLPGVQRPERWKTLAPPVEYDVLDDAGCLLLHGQRIALSICEDVWEREPNQHPWYASSIVPQLVATQPDVLINISASPSRCGKEARRATLLQNVASTYHLPLFYVNQVGGVDELVFDGGSRLLNGRGDTLSRSPLFAPAFQMHHLQEEIFQQKAPWPEQAHHSAITAVQDEFSPYDETDLPRLYHALVLGIQDYFRKCGFQRAVLGLSGGLDSAVNAVLLADALGPEQVAAFVFPSSLTPSQNQKDAETLARNLGIRWAVAPIAAIQQACLQERNALQQALQASWGTPNPHSFAEDNIQAISRATLLRLMGNDFVALPVATSDKSEFYMGYTTVNGDMSGALAPLGDVCKTKVRALARWLNVHHTRFRVIPEAVVERPSGADLAMNPETGKLLTAEEALMPYEVIDELIWRVEAHGISKEDLITLPWSWEKRNGKLSQEQKGEWVTTFFRRMQASAFKWWIAPPTLLVDVEGSLVKSAYHHTITANGTPY
jgi:NAD+ synthase (glutamine-hydrolysing)